MNDLLSKWFIPTSPGALLTAQNALLSYFVKSDVKARQLRLSSHRHINYIELKKKEIDDTIAKKLQLVQIATSRLREIEPLRRRVQEMASKINELVTQKKRLIAQIATKETAAEHANDGEDSAKAVEYTDFL